jgi:hypothetical protein
MQSLVHWDDYLEEVKEASNNDLLMCALDIYNGKIVGLAGLPDIAEKRQILVGDRMHELIKLNVNACIKQLEHDRKMGEKTLALTIEFCMKMGSTDNIFGDLFDIFVFHGTESIFFECLHPFIVSGRFKKAKLTNQFIV